MIADAEWLNQEAQNALLRLLEEPPPRTALLLVAATASGLLATVRSRCQRVAFPRPEPRLADAPDDVRAQAERVAELGALVGARSCSTGRRSFAVRAATRPPPSRRCSRPPAWCCASASTERCAAGDRSVGAELDAFRELLGCRKTLVQRNANPQMIAERALLALHGALR